MSSFERINQGKGEQKQEWRRGGVNNFVRFSSHFVLEDLRDFVPRTLIPGSLALRVIDHTGH